MYCVIGSGPAGVACAKALLARGAKVLMLDAGIELETDRAKKVHELSKTKSSDWEPENVAAIRGDLAADAKGIPLKLLFGSDFPYRETVEKIPWQNHATAIRPSLAFGGLSNVWGAAMLPPRAEDISDWPIKIFDLTTHYRAVAEMAGLAAQPDDLEEIFPLHSENTGALKSSRQAKLILDNLNRRREKLRARGWRFGKSRLAVRGEDSPSGIGCVYCGLCMSGCVFGCIYNAADTVRELRRENNFQYQRDVIVTKLRENSEKVFIEGFHRLTRAPLSFEVNRVYLAAGVIPTAQILLRSQNDFDCPLTLRDSQYFLFPILLARRTRDVRSEMLYTLSQIFIELQNPKISRRSVHLQIYTYSDIIGQAVQKSLGPLKIFLAKFFEERMIVAQGYLHSDESSAIEMTLRRASGGEKDFLQLEAKINPETRGIVKKVTREMFKQSRALGGLVLPPLLQIAEPGRGFHCGGSFPMRENPRQFESDLLGRPFGWSRVHVVDASVLPNVSATTITFSVMANAHRIGWETAIL